MSNLKDKYTEEEWDELEQATLEMATADNDAAKEQAVKDMQIKVDGKDYTLNFKELEDVKKFYDEL